MAALNKIELYLLKLGRYFII